MNELMNNDGFRITSVELVKLINDFRILESNKAELKHKSFMAKIRKELETMESLGLEGGQNILPTSYLDEQGREFPRYRIYDTKRKWSISNNTKYTS